MNVPSILIVDDCYEDRYLLKRMIKDVGLSDQVFEEEDGETALEFLANYRENCSKYPGKFPPLLIFLDINMPKVGGFEFLEQFAEMRNGNKDYDPCVICMFTSSAWEKEIEKSKQFEMVKGYIVKIPETEDFLAQVKACLNTCDG